MKRVCTAVLVLLAFIATAAESMPYNSRWRWRNDDGDVYRATWKDSMNCPISYRGEENIRLRKSYEFDTAFTPMTITLRYGTEPHLTNDADSTRWTLISKDESGMFFLSDSRYLTDGLWQRDNPLLPGWVKDSLLAGPRYGGTLTIDSSSGPRFAAKESEGYEIEYCMQMNRKIPESSVYYFLTFYDGKCQSESDPPSVRTPPFYWNYYKGPTGYVFKIQFVDELNGWYSRFDPSSPCNLMRTSDGGKTWRPAGERGFLYNYFKFTDKDTGWAFLEGRLCKSTDGGSSWTPLEYGADITAYPYRWYFSDARHGWMSFYDSSMIRTIDGGATWEKICPLKGYVNSLYFISDQVGFAYLSDRDGMGVGVYKTTTGGLSWRRIPLIDVPLATFEHIDQIQFVDMDRGWASTHVGKILQTTDGGEHWTLLRAASEPPVLSFAFSDRNNGWAVGERGTILATKDGGVTWEKRPSGTGHELQSVAVVNDHVWIGGADGTILSSETGGWMTTADEAKETFLPQACVLYPNYPNPFNPQTRIRYALPSASLVTIKIFDMLGREVSTLVNEWKPAGTYEGSWNASRHASGVYICRMQAGAYQQARMMALVK